MPDRPLTPKQQRFVAEYLVDLNATAAAGRAGYSDPNIGRQLITKHNVAEAIAVARGRQQQRIEITADDVRRGLHKEAQWYGDDGSASARVSAWRELGKLMGFYPADGVDLKLLGRLELIEEVVNVDATHDHKTNGQVASGAGRLPS